MLLHAACLEGQRMGFAAFTFPISTSLEIWGQEMQQVALYRRCLHTEAAFFQVLLGG